MPIIEARNLCKTFQYYKKEVGFKNSIRNLVHREMLEKQAVNDVSFSIEQGEIVGFLGPNGAGKTTTLKMLSGIIHPTSGSAKVLDYVPWERKNKFKMQFSIVMAQKSQLWIDLPAIDSFHLNKYIYEIDEADFNKTVYELAEILDVKHLLPVQVRRLSFGEKMKMEIIASLLHNPKVIFLDEPTIGLDLVSQIKVRDFFAYLNHTKKATVLLTSHNMADISQLCPRVVIINEGRLLYDGDIGKLSQSMDKKIIRLTLSRDVTNDSLAGYGMIIQNDNQQIRLEVEQKRLQEVAKAMLDALPLVDFTVEDIPIEQSIASFYEKRTDRGI